MNRGIRFIALAYVLLAVGTSLGLYQGFAAAQKAKRVAIQLRADVQERCRVSEASRAVIRREHEVKLKRLKDYLAAHPNGIPGITRKELLQGIQDEKVVVSQVQPHPCSDLKGR